MSRRNLLWHHGRGRLTGPSPTRDRVRHHAALAGIAFFGGSPGTGGMHCGSNVVAGSQQTAGGGAAASVWGNLLAVASAEQSFSR
jgi:hypothetical protein